MELDHFSIARHGLYGYHVAMEKGVSQVKARATSFKDFVDAYAGLFDARPAGGDYVRMAWIVSPYGPLLAGADSSSLRFLDFADRAGIDAHIASLRISCRLPLVPGENALIDRLRDELASYFSGALREFSLPVASAGTPFQELVWRELRGIPYGGTLSYGELARRIGSPGASRAVGAANGSNRVLILVPCHRVVNANGTPGGYSGGSERKRSLLELERAALAT